MSNDTEQGFLWNLSLPLKAINESGIRLKTDLWVIYFVVKAAIDSNWADKETVGKKQYSWVSNKYIKGQLRSLPDVADITDNALYRKIKQLEEVGLLTRMEGNDKKGRCYLGTGPMSDHLNFSRPSENLQGVGDVPIEKTQGDPLQNFNTPIEKTQGYNTIQDNKDKSIKVDDPHSQANGAKAPTKRKLKKTRGETTDFYLNEVESFLKNPKLPKELSSAAAARSISPETLLDAYKELVEYMTLSSDMWPDGFWGCVLTKPYQLGFEQFCKLILVAGMKRVQIKEYLNQWENKKYDNDNIYATFITWWNKEKSAPSPNGQAQSTGKGMSIPKEVRQ